MQGSASSPTADRVSGKTFRFDANEAKIESVAFNFDEAKCVLTLRNGAGEQRIECSHGVWLKGAATLDSDQSRPVAASGAWTADDTYTIHLYFYETPFRLSIACRFDVDRLTCDSKMNVGFGPTERPQLVGRMA